MRTALGRMAGRGSRIVMALLGVSAGLAVLPAAAPDPVQEELAKLQGDWTVELLEEDGIPQPDDVVKALRVRIVGSRLQLRERIDAPRVNEPAPPPAKAEPKPEPKSEPRSDPKSDPKTPAAPDPKTDVKPAPKAAPPPAEEVEEFLLRIIPGGDPPQVDLTRSDSKAGKPDILAIYKLDGDRLSICGSDRNIRPKTFETKKKTGVGLLVLRRRAADPVPKSDSPKVDSPKTETPKGETPKADAPKDGAPKAESPKGETAP